MKPSPIAEHDHVAGPSDAPVTLIEYGDFECPFCVKAYPVIEKTREEFRGKIRFVYRHFPKSASQGFTKQAAEVSEFAASHGKFWEMHGYLFTHPEQHDMEHLLLAAESIGLDQAECSRALVERRFSERVRELTVGAVRGGILGTPTLFVNGARYEDRIEEELLIGVVKMALWK